MQSCHKLLEKGGVLKHSLSEHLKLGIIDKSSQTAQPTFIVVGSLLFFASTHVVGCLHLSELNGVSQTEFKGNIWVSASHFETSDYMVSLGASCGHQSLDGLFHLGRQVCYCRLGMHRLWLMCHSGCCNDWCICWLKRHQRSGHWLFVFFLRLL